MLSSGESLGRIIIWKGNLSTGAPFKKLRLHNRASLPGQMSPRMLNATSSDVTIQLSVYPGRGVSASADVIRGGEAQKSCLVALCGHWHAVSHCRCIHQAAGHHQRLMHAFGSCCRWQAACQMFTHPAKWMFPVGLVCGRHWYGRRFRTVSLDTDINGKSSD